MAENYSITAIFNLKDNLSNQLKGITNGINATAKESTKLGSSLNGAFQDSNGRWREANGRFVSSKEKLQQLEQQSGKTVNSLTQSLKSVAVGAGVFAVISKGLDVVKDSIGSAVGRFDTLNAYPKVMKQMGYSTQDTQESIQLLKKGIDGLPTSLQDITKNAQSFAILTGSAKGGAQTANALNDAFLASGASAADASRGVQQYSQMLAAGKVDMQSWRTLTETMPYALNEVAKAFGFTGKSAQKDLYNALESGKITTDQLNQKFIELDGGVTGFANTARTATGGIGTSFTNMRNAVVNGLANTITAIDNGIKSAGVNGGIAELFNDAKNIINDSFQKINGIIMKVIPKVIQLLQFLTPVIETVGPVIAAMGGSFLTASTSVWAFNKATNAVSATLTAITQHPIIAMLFAIGTALVYAYNNFKPFHDWVNKTAEKVKDFAKEISNNKEKMDQLKVVLEGLAAGGALAVLVGGFIKFKNALKDINKAKDVGEKFKGIGSKASEGSKGTSKMSNSLLKASLGIGIISVSLAALALALTGLAKTGSSGALVVGVFGLAIAGIIATLGVFGPVLDASSVGLAALSLLFVSIGGAIFIASAGITMVIDAISRLIEILNNANQAGENAKILLQSIGEGFALMILTFIATIEDNVPIIVQKFIDMLIQVFNTIGANAPLIVEAFTDMIVNMINAISNNLGRVVDAATNLVITLMNSLADNALRLVDSGLDLLDKVLHGITDNLHKLTDTAISFVERLAFEIGYAAGRLLASGTTLVDNVIDGFKSGYSRGGGLGSGFVNEIANGIKPSSLFHSGKAIIDGLIDGVKSAWNTGKKIFEDITKAIPKLKGPYSYDKVLLTPAGNAIMDGLNNGIINGYKTVKSNLSGMADDLESNFSGQLNANAAQTTHNVSQIEVTANNSTNGLLREVVKAIREGQVITINGNQMIGATANGYDGALGDIMTDRRRNQL